MEKGSGLPSKFLIWELRDESASHPIEEPKRRNTVERSGFGLLWVREGHGSCREGPEGSE